MGLDERERNNVKREKSVKKFVLIGMLSGIAYVLMFLSFPIPPLPAYLSVDFSDIPAIIASFIFGPVAGITVIAIKNLLNYLAQGSMTGIPIGQFANFTAGVLFVLPTYFVFNKVRSMKGLAVGLVAGTFSMAVFMSILNYFVFLPAYTIFMGWPAEPSSIVIQSIVYGVLPFNIIKGILVGVIFALLYKKLSHWLTKEMYVKPVSS
ncbi:riboflavin transporter FmnP [Sutcliffiella cohnii]|uniref:Riboflavin transporter n=1 Tax=Sutcliffiella cohnii TaxID=33932 RepID=A0A223KS74_9BACI|nr:riboflavin transporter FmnP [Sutcliffiella cohnii]